MDLNMAESKLKQTPADLPVCVLYEPHFLLESRFCEMSWLSVYWKSLSMIGSLPVTLEHVY